MQVLFKKFHEKTNETMDEVAINFFIDTIFDLYFDAMDEEEEGEDPEDEQEWDYVTRMMKKRADETDEKIAKMKEQMDSIEGKLDALLCHLNAASSSKGKTVKEGDEHRSLFSFLAVSSEED
jgi:hypothetical protein